MSKERHS